MRGDAGESFKRPKKVIGAEARDLRKAAQVLRDVSVILDHTNNPRDASQGTWRSGRPAWPNAAFDLYRASGHLNAKLLNRVAIGACQKGCSLRDQRS
jgi:hypothetical protein